MTGGIFLQEKIVNFIRFASRVSWIVLRNRPPLSMNSCVAIPASPARFQKDFRLPCGSFFLLLRGLIPGLQAVSSCFRKRASFRDCCKTRAKCFARCFFKIRIPGPGLDSFFAWPRGRQQNTFFSPHPEDPCLSRYLNLSGHGSAGDFGC